MAQFPEVGVKLVADGAGKYIGDLGRAGDATDGLGRSIGGASGVMGGFASSLSNVGALLVGGVALGVGALGIAFGKFASDGISAAIDLEHQLSAIAAVLKMAADEVQPLQELISDLALNPNLTVTTEQAAAAIEMLARNGLNMTQIMDGAAEAVIALANATGGEFAQSADVMTDAMAQFGIEADGLEGVIDGITGVVNNSKFTMNDFALALAQGGGVAATVGVEFDDFTTTIAAIAPLFASGQDAGTSLKTMLLRLVPASGPAAKAMEELGLITEDGANAFFDAEGNMKGMADIAGILNTAMADLTEEQKNSYLNTIFGTDAMRAAAGVAGFTTEDFEALGENVNLAGQAFQSAGTRVDNVKGAMQILGGIFEALGIQLGQKLLPFIRAFVDQAIVIADVYGGAAIEAISAFVDGVVGMITNIQGGMTPLSAFIDAIEGIAPQGVIDALVSLRDDVLPPLTAAFYAFSDWFTEHQEKILSVLGAIAVGIAAFVIITTVVGWITSFIAAIAAVSAAVTASGGILAAIVAFLGGPVTLAIAAVAAVIALFAYAWSQNWGDIQGKTAEAWAVLQVIFAAVSAWITETLVPVLQTLYDKWVTEVWPAIQEATSVAWEAVKVVFEQISTWVTETLVPTLQKLYDKWVNDVWPAIQTATQNVWTVIKEVFTELGKWINRNIVPWVDHLSKKWGEEWVKIQAGAQVAWGILEPIFTAVQEWLKDKLPPVLEAFGSVWDTIMSGLRTNVEIALGVWDNFVTAVMGFWDWISNKTFSFDITLPDLPEWALPGSPLPIHTAWANFADDMNKTVIKPIMEIGEFVSEPESAGLAGAGMAPVSSPSQINNISNRNTTVNFTGNYSSSPEVTDSGTLTRVIAGYA